MSYGISPLLNMITE